MPALEGGPSPHRWNQIRRLPLHPAIRTLREYEQGVVAGTFDALDYLRGIRPLRQLTVADMQQVHLLMFKRVHPWAGQFRLPGQMAIIAGLPAADPQRIERELNLASFQMREMQESVLVARDPHQMLAALAFFHVRFERVHPFLDGNGRAGRAILAIQFEKTFGCLPKFSDQQGYREAMRASVKRDLAPLLNYLSQSTGVPAIRARWQSPFQIHPLFLEEAAAEPTFEDDLARSRIVS